MAAGGAARGLERVAGRLAALAEAAPSEEVCGLVVERAGGALEVVPIRNAAGDGQGPGGGAARRHAFVLDPREHLAVERRIREQGGRVAALYHSHVDAPARLSAADREALTVGGGPALPGADLVVLSTRSGKVTKIAVFRWSGARFGPVAALRVPRGDAPRQHAPRRPASRRRA